MYRESQIDALASFLIKGLVARGAIKPLADEAALAACVAEMMSENFEIEAQLEDEADRMAEELARKDPRADVSRLRAMILKRLAEKKDFTL